MKIPSNFLKIFLTSIIFSAVFSCAVSFSPVLAQSSGCTTQSTQSGYLPNPLCVGSVNDILYLAVDIATYIGVVLAVVFLIYAGFKYVAARGNSEKITEAHHFLLAVVIGIGILIGASGIVNVIKNTLTSAGVVNSNAFNAPLQQGSVSSVNSNTNSGGISNTNTSGTGNQTGIQSGATLSNPNDDGYDDGDGEDDLNQGNSSNGTAPAQNNDDGTDDGDGNGS